MSRPLIREVLNEASHIFTRELAVLTCYGIVIFPHIETFTQHDIGASLLLVVFLIILLFVIGGGRGRIKLGNIMDFQGK